MVRSEIIATFLPPRVKETFLASYVLEQFQAPEEDLNSFVMSVVAAAAVLRFTGSASQLLHRVVQNLHPKVKSYFVFEGRPESVRDLFSLANTVTETVAIGQRKRLTTARQPGSVPAGVPRPIVEVGVGDIGRHTISGGTALLGHSETKWRNFGTPP
jgi:hypothetical protein